MYSSLLFCRGPDINTMRDCAHPLFETDAYVACDVGGGLIFIPKGDVRGEVTFVPPPPARAEQFAVLGVVAARRGFRALVLSLPNCRPRPRPTLGAVIYIAYAHRLVDLGPGYAICPVEPGPDPAARVARGNIAFRSSYEDCTPRCSPRVVPICDGGVLDSALSVLDALSL